MQSGQRPVTVYSITHLDGTTYLCRACDRRSTNSLEPRNGGNIATDDEWRVDCGVCYNNCMFPSQRFTPATDRLVSVYLTVAQYPILGSKIRSLMRKRLYTSGYITKERFDDEVRKQAIQSQVREGLNDPFNEEIPETWEKRINVVRDQLTDYYFSIYFPFQELESVITDILHERGVEAQDSLLSINPELAPLDLIIEQAQTIELLPGPQRVKLEPRLSELKVVLIRHLISDQLRYINIAKEWFTVNDLADVRKHKIGSGRIGGKAAGMLLANRIIQRSMDDEVRKFIRVPETYFIGSDVFYNFMEVNNLVHWNDQKYKSEDEMRQDFPQIQDEFERGTFSIEVIDQLEGILRHIGEKPIIVRSSSLLEDNFGTSFAGKYESWFCPNQADHQENLRYLIHAIAKVYSSTLNPNALLYRRSKGLQDYDERMAILIQSVEGERFGRYYLPLAAGVAFSRNLYRWAPQIRREDGFIRLVWGLGTRAVDRVGNDYPRLVALSHPLLRPNSSPEAIRRYSQQFVDVIDIELNELRSVPIHDVLSSSYDGLRYIAQQDEEDYFSSLRSNFIEGNPKSLRITMEDLLRRTPFATRMRMILQTLEQYYQAPVDMEFTAALSKNNDLKPEVDITLLQCRPQSQLETNTRVQLPANLEAKNTIFSSRYMVPEGYIDEVRKILFVTPEEYYALPTNEDRSRLVRAISKINGLIGKTPYICIGPGRWGTSNPDLGVTISYGDIYHTRALVELTGHGYGQAPEPSLGTHFFQDLLESQIYPLALYLDDAEVSFNREFFYESPNHLLEYLPEEASLEKCLRILHVNDTHPNERLVVVMDGAKGEAAAYFRKD